MEEAGWPRADLFFMNNALDHGGRAKGSRGLLAVGGDAELLSKIHEVNHSLSSTR
jgi:hypothetical protein